MAVDLGPATKLFEQFQAAFNKGDSATAKQLLSSLKLELTKFPSLPPLQEPSPNAQQQQLLARSVLELAVLLSARLRDDAGFERHAAQLAEYQGGGGGAMGLPPSPLEPTLTALTLLRLLVQNRVADFHTALEIIPDEVQASTEVAQVADLERWLMEGSYQSVLAAQAKGPAAGGPHAEAFAHLFASLAATVRDEIAGCSERSYESLGVSAARELMMFGSDAEVEAYAAGRGWAVAGGRITFKGGEGEAGAGAVPALEVINHMMTYSREIEQII